MKTKPKISLALLCGGKSPEHKGSIESALYILRHINIEIWNVSFFYQKNDGHFANQSVLADSFDEWLLDKQIKAINKENTHEVKLLKDRFSQAIDHNGDFFEQVEAKQIDIVFPAMHGPGGEDGSIQGFLEFIGIPYVGCGIGASVLSNDKSLTKIAARLNGIQVNDWFEIKKIKNEWYYAAFLEREADSQLVLNKKITAISQSKLLELIKSNFEDGIFVKPAHLGSSLGVVKIDGSKNILSVIQDCFDLDTKVIVEAQCHFQEYGIAYLSNYKSRFGSLIKYGLSVNNYDYNAKFGEEAQPDTIPALVSAQTSSVIKENIKKTIQILGLNGCARIDFFLHSSEEKQKTSFVLNEVNTMPGFGLDSVFAKSFEPLGLQTAELIDHIAKSGFKQFQLESELSSHFRETL